MFKKEKKITVAYAPDDKFVPLALVSMTSILENTKSQVEFIILYSKLNKASFDLLHTLKKYKHCKLSYVKIDEKKFEKFPLTHWVPVQTWFRTQVVDLRPDIDKALYLDCDTLALGDIASLWDINMEDTTVAGITDVWNVKYSCERLEMVSGRYFNAGVILINCKRWRKLNIFEKMKQCLNDFGNKITVADQDVLNKLFDEDKLSLPQKYNYMETWWHDYYTEYADIDLENYEEAKKSPVIIHFTAYKPYLCTSKHSFKKEWWHYASLTAAYVYYLELHYKEAETKLKNLKPQEKSIYE